MQLIVIQITHVFAVLMRVAHRGRACVKGVGTYKGDVRALKMGGHVHEGVGGAVLA